eukprot:5949433-Pyramimonas_sp.AAC.1
MAPLRTPTVHDCFFTSGPALKKEPSVNQAPLRRPYHEKLLEVWAILQARALGLRAAPLRDSRPPLGGSQANGANAPAPFPVTLRTGC